MDGTLVTKSQPATVVGTAADAANPLLVNYQGTTSTCSGAGGDDYTLQSGSPPQAKLTLWFACRLRRTARPIAPNPPIIIAQVAGSGTPPATELAVTSKDVAL